ncbi:uncharacterized protein LOC126900296 [Daktulosphaira vitifoliae]|uniref:uncharacterized protein LOC126900296 n=1 Tax=Daktulosphaira vitifoliae TaxID=58002 RepID=UPI0021AA00DC|nr:uncharacterized protein LOC126900296 [Daktulosphaira vitifoliae]XP_050531874.1 uncharacterized protein LOC126900296 [Daktulosphaira vitifoliae]
MIVNNSYGIFLFYFCSIIQLIIPFVFGTNNYVKMYPKLGENVTLKCGNDYTKKADVSWKMNHKELPGRVSILTNGDLFITNVEKSDSGTYVCDLGTANTYADHVPLNEIELKVISVPSPLVGVKVIPYTVLIHILWKPVEDDGGFPISNVTIRIKEINNSDDKWITVYSNISSLQKEIYHLQFNTLYIVEMWVANIVGNSEKTVVITKTLSELSEIDLEKHLMEGIDKFHTKAWIFAVVVIMTTFSIFGIAFCYLLLKDPRTNKRLDDVEDVERIELIPNITLNPGYCET